MSADPTRIRPAEPADAHGIAEVHVASWQAAYRGQLPDDFLDALSVEARFGGWDEALRQPNGSTVIVVEDDGGICGNARARQFYERHSWLAEGSEKSQEVRGVALNETRYGIDIQRPPP